LLPPQTTDRSTDSPTFVCSFRGGQTSVRRIAFGVSPQETQPGRLCKEQVHLAGGTSRCIYTHLIHETDPKLPRTSRRVTRRGDQNRHRLLCRKYTVGIKITKKIHTIFCFFCFGRCLPAGGFLTNDVIDLISFFSLSFGCNATQNDAAVMQAWAKDQKTGLVRLVINCFLLCEFFFFWILLSS
jgi:hypothetical protein